MTIVNHSTKASYIEFEGLATVRRKKARNIIKKILIDKELERLYCEIYPIKTLKDNNIMKFYTSWDDTSNRNINFVTKMFTSGLGDTFDRYRLRQKNIRAMKHWCRQFLRGLLYLHSHDLPLITKISIVTIFLSMETKEK
ncbi:hypothetical protein Ddye_008228 [Dipteronia dyeriana]|uniref:non-specific serine/threonine protein kinase n=1 Tax=Dipteronia dyeriana TaxID=168575 RepID=A0AAD9X9J1_9ROSI|nr:hypothetical protein Ddye_008228 [Dipteronia dyeriana]